MSVPPPLPSAYGLLLVALPGVWLLAAAIADGVTRDRATRIPVSMGLAIGGWVLAIHVCSLAARSFRVGLPVATLGLAVAGIAADAERRRQRATSQPGAPPSRWMWITMAVSALCVSRAAVGWFFHDELLPVGHMSIASEIANGVYPPRNLLFPELLLRYHYGFDVLSASLATILRLRIDHAIDFATIVLWCASWCLAWVLGARLGQRFAWLTPLLVLFGGSIPVGCETNPRSIAFEVLVDCRVGKSFSLNAPVVSYFFQHPWGLGIPLLLTAVLVVLERGGGRRVVRLAVLALLFAALSISEIVIFLGLLPCALAVEGCEGGRFARRPALRMLGVVAVALYGANLMGGFFASSADVPPLAFDLHPGFTNTLADTLAWNAKTFGVLGLAGVAGLWIAPDGPARGSSRVLFGLLAAGSFVVVNAVRYAGSSDIMKFATLASIALGVLAAGAISRLISTAAQQPRRALASALALAIVVGAAGEGFVFLGSFVVDSGAIPMLMRTHPHELDDADLAAMTFVRTRIRAGELVYRRQPASLAYAQWGGLPEPWVDWTAAAFGVPRRRIATRNSLLERTSPRVAAYRAEGFRWLVLGPHDGQLRTYADAWIASGEAELAATFGALRVIELR